jgi:CO dehydrogenase/acetyl-CoA synthase gamma subunit (corrinoid Fe-S protein)
MAMIYESLKVEKIMATLEELPVDLKREIVLPGFASPLKQPLERQIEWQVKVGPLCIAELPLFLGDDWEVPADLNIG